MKTKLILFVLLLGAGKLLYDAGGDEAHAGPDRPRLAGGLGGRMVHGVGVIGARVVSPAVHSMLLEHTSDLSTLDPVIRKAPPVRRQQVRGLLHRIEQLDSMAVERLALGHPVAAVKFALQGGGLVEAVRDRVREDAAIR